MIIIIIIIIIIIVIIIINVVVVVVFVVVFVVVLLNFLSEITSKFRDVGRGNLYNISNVYTEFIVYS
jgi:hypothetical protein